MLFVEDLKPMKIYTKPMYLPTLDGSKKKGSAIFLLTPNYESSKALLNSNLFINNMRFQSYYIEKDLTYFISSKAMDKVDDVTESYIHDFNEMDFYQSLYEMSSKERNNLDDSVFGLPKKRKYPLNDKAHVKSAIRFFNYVDEEDEAELARNLNKAIKKFFSAEELPKVGENNRFSKYYHPTTSTKEGTILDEGILRDEQDIYYNKDKFDKGKINLCFITGLSGSGKSTMANSMDGKDGIESYEIDDVLANANWFTMENFKEYGDLIYSFFNGPGSKYYVVKDKKKVAEADPNDGDGDYDKNITTDFVNYSIKYAASHKNKKFVINGLQLLFFIEPSYLKDYAVYIKGTSAFKSLYRAAKRDEGNKGESSKLKILKRMLKRSKHMSSNEKIIDKWRVYYNNLQSVNEGTVFTEPDIFFNKKKFMSGESNICFVTGRSGAGKTTIADDLAISLQAAGWDAEQVSLDVVINNQLVDDIYLINYYPMIYAFFGSSVGKKYRLTKESIDNVAARYDKNFDKYDAKLTKVFVDFAIKWAKKHPDTKYIIEGVWIAIYMDPANFREYPVYIKGTSALTSIYRATIRDMDLRDARDQSIFTVVRQKINSLGTITFNSKYNKFYKYFEHLQYKGYGESVLIENSYKITNTEDTPVESVSALILSNGQILVENHVKCQAYTIPGGKIDPGESPDDTLKRELGEELGIEPIDYTLYFENTFLCEYPVGSGSYTWFKDYCYKILRYTGDITNKESEKHSSVEFLDVDDLMYHRQISSLLQGLLSYISDNEIATCEPYKGVSIEDISCDGYEQDMVILKHIATVDTYGALLQALELPFHNGIPHLRFIAADTEDFNIHDDCVDVYVYSDSLDRISVEQYIDNALSVAMSALIVYNYPKLKQTKLLSMIVDFLMGYNNDKAQLIADLIDKYGSLSALYSVINQDDGLNVIYKDSVELGYDFIDSVDYFIESERNINTASSADSLTRSLKYRNSTKIKARISKIRNTTKRLLDDIADSIKAKTTPKLPNAGDTSSSTKSVKESVLSSLEEGSYILNGDYVTVFEDATNDPILRRMLYQERIVKRKDVLALLDRVKSDVSYIKFAYPELDRYQNRNLFIDLYYYNQAFFKNNQLSLKRGFNLYLDFLDRLINDKRIIAAGYKRRTVFIPVNDWNINHATRMWMFREGLNPISLIYELMNSNANGLKKLFNGIDVIFFDKYRYFKVDFTKDPKSIKQDAIKFKLFISKINKGEEFEDEDKDSTEIVQTKKSMKTDIVDKIEKTKGVDLTDADNEVKAEKEKTTRRSNKPVVADPYAQNKTPAVKKVENKPTPSKRVSTKDKEEDKKKEDRPSKSKASQNKAPVNTAGMTDKQVLMTIIKDIDQAVDGSADMDDLLDNLDDDDFKDLILGLDSNKDDEVNISAARSERMTELDKQLLNIEVKGRSIRDILADDEDVEEGVNKKAELPKTDLPVASPNEEWHNMSYINFDQSYDLEKDLVNIFKYWSKVSRPLSILNIKAEDNSTSEDRMDLYTVEYEDYRGKRYTIKLDIPKMKNGRFLIRGNKKMLQTQFFNMPIVKTDLDTAQIVTNYKKIIIFRYNTASGRSLPNSARFIKALGKYTSKDIKVTVGDNSRVCAKYVLPIDYIDIAGSYSIIETKDYKFYFNQDEIRKEYEVSDSLGVPYGIDKRDNSLLYFSNKSTKPFVDTLYSQIAYSDKGNKEFQDLFAAAKPPSRCTFVMAKVMGSYIPLVVVCAYSEGLTQVLKKANIQYELVDKLRPEQKNNPSLDYIRFSDGYLVYDIDYSSSLLMNGLKDCDTEGHSIMQLDDRNMYLDFLDNYGGRIKADGLDNFYDCEIDPITEETLRYYKLPTDYVSVLLYANYLLSDNKFVKHTDTSSRRIRRLELVAAYTYQVLSEVYGAYSTSIKHNHGGASFTCKQSAVIDKIVADPTFSDYSTGNMVNDVECTNAISTKGLSGMNNDRSYNLDKRTYDDSMVGVLGMSTGFSGNVGITRQATLDANVQGGRGYVKDNKGNTDNMNTATTLTATESVVPMIANHDDPMRIAMTFIQSSKHSMRTMYSDPLLVTSGSDEALPYIASDQFAYKAKNDGVVKELNEEYMIIEYKDGSKEYINLAETIEKNSDGGFYVPLKLDADPKLKVGSKVKPNQIVAYDKTSVSNSVGETDNLAYNVGKLAKIAILNMDDCYEDAGVVTSKMAHYLATNIIMKHDCVLDKNTNIYNVAKVGAHVEEGDPLIIWQTPYDEDEANALLKALAGDKDVVSELGRRSLKAETTGTIVGMKVYRTVETEELSDSLQDLVKKYEKPITELQNRLKKEGIEDTDIPANYPLTPTGKLKGAASGVLIEFYVEYTDTVGVGDKITYNAANKAVIKNVIPEGLEPYTDFRPEEEISAFVSESSISKRLVTSTMLYGSLQKLMIELDRSCKDLAGIEWDHTQA